MAAVSVVPRIFFSTFCAFYYNVSPTSSRTHCNNRSSSSLRHCGGPKLTINAYPFLKISFPFGYTQAKPKRGKPSSAMRFCLDLRYGVPWLTNGLLLLFALLQGRPWNQLEALITRYDFHGSPPLLNLAFCVLLIFYLICLFVSLKLPVVITRLRPPIRALSVLTFFLIVEPIQIRVGDHSAPLTLSLLVAILFSPSFFWAFFAFIALGSCCNGFLWTCFRSFCTWLHRSLNKIPTILVTCCCFRRDFSPPATTEALYLAPPQPPWELEMVEVET